MQFRNPFTRKKKVHKVGNKEVTLVECYRDKLGNICAVGYLIEKTEKSIEERTCIKERRRI